MGRDALRIVRGMDPFAWIAAVAFVLWGLSVAALHDWDAYRSRISWELVAGLSDVQRFLDREGRLPRDSSELSTRNDPWGRPYRYELAPGCVDPMLERCRVFTLGSDDAEGGRGRATDRSSRWFWPGR